MTRLTYESIEKYPDAPLSREDLCYVITELAALFPELDWPELEMTDIDPR